MVILNWNSLISGHFELEQSDQRSFCPGWSDERPFLSGIV